MDIDKATTTVDEFTEKFLNNVGPNEMSWADYLMDLYKVAHQHGAEDARIKWSAR